MSKFAFKNEHKIFIVVTMNVKYQEMRGKY